jgi:hypothetical protein
MGPPGVAARPFGRGGIAPSGGSNFELDRMQSHISERLETGHRNGRLSNDDYFSMKHDLDSIDEGKSRMMGMNGSLSAEQNQRLLDRLTSLNDRLRSTMYDRQNAGNNRTWY